MWRITETKKRSQLKTIVFKEDKRFPDRLKYLKFQQKYKFS